MKKGLYILIALPFMLTSFVSLSNAGTLSIGGQSWYVFWDSGMARMTTEVTENQLEKEMKAGLAAYGDFAGFTLDIGEPETKGFVFGPVIGYQTADKKWDFRADIMWFGHYTTSIDTTVKIQVNSGIPLLDGSIPFTINTELEIEQRDVDLQAGRMITDFIRGFAGIKYNYYKSEIKADYSINYTGTDIINFSADIDFSYEGYMIMPYAGLGIVYSLSDTFTARADLGAGLPVYGKVKETSEIKSSLLPDEKITIDDGEVVMAWGLMLDVSLAYKFAKKVNLQLGYKYKRMTMKVENVDIDADGEADDTSENVDVLHGVTVRAEYLLNI